MKPRRKVLTRESLGTVWSLHLECGHVAFRSAQYSHRELPEHVLCEACNELIGSQVKNPTGMYGTISSYSGGLFDITWKNDGSTRLTLDELREKAEIL